MITNKYLAALLQIAIILAGAITLVPVGTFTRLTPAAIGAGLGLVSLALGAVLTYFVPLLGAKNSSVLKVAIPVITAVIAVGVDYVARGDFSSASFGFLVLGVLNAVASKIGVSIRNDTEQLQESVSPSGMLAALQAAQQPTEITDDAPKHAAS